MQSWMRVLQKFLPAEIWEYILLLDFWILHWWKKFYLAWEICRIRSLKIYWMFSDVFLTKSLSLLYVYSLWKCFRFCSLCKHDYIWMVEVWLSVLLWLHWIYFRTETLGKLKWKVGTVISLCMVTSIWRLSSLVNEWLNVKCSEDSSSKIIFCSNSVIQVFPSLREIPESLRIGGSKVKK